MELDEIRLRVNMLKESKEKDQKDVKDIELLLLWDFVKSIAESGIKGQKRIAEYLLSSGIKSVGQRELINNQIWNKPFASFAEFENALKSEDIHQA